MAQKTSIVGVVADFRRDFENDFKATKCCIYGINKEEYETLKSKGQINPQ